MQQAHKNSNQRRSVVRSSWRMGLVLTLALYSAAVVGAQSGGDRYTCNLTSGGGSSVWVSCGSTAGNFIYTCDRYGCDDAEGEFNQYLADQQCGQIQQEGHCPESTPSEPFPTPTP